MGKPTHPKKETELTPAEWTVIKVVWAEEPVTAPEVHRLLESSTGWTYSTVRTLMDRMVLKGVLTGKKDGKLNYFRSVLTRKDAQKGELFQTLKQAFDGAMTPMIQCLLDTQSLSSEEIKEIEELIRKSKRKNR